MKASKDSTVGGKWHDKKALKTGDLAKIKTEATETPNQMGGTQWVAKIAIKGVPEALNMAINKPSKNALIDAFGEETNDWINKVLTLHVEKTIVSGKRGVAVYLVPENYVVGEDSGGYVVIRPAVEPPAIVKKAKGAKEEKENEYPSAEDEGIDINDVPF